MIVRLKLTTTFHLKNTGSPPSLALRRAFSFLQEAVAARCNPSGLATVLMSG
jgi:hypothetical protein